MQPDRRTPPAGRGTGDVHHQVRVDERATNAFSSTLPLPGMGVSGKALRPVNKTNFRAAGGLQW
ncbi:hypothetical protein GCM10010310_79760 [Streptomyces violaceolatus]|uniref:Uncharacterized protein n=1 Tax=Streptomyces violaceolatus TaxID=67378 RepID=A0ABN3TJH7_9ACTN